MEDIGKYEYEKEQENRLIKIESEIEDLKNISLSGSNTQGMLKLVELLGDRFDRLISEIRTISDKLEDIIIHK